jgi:hypothetical protein
MEPDTIVVLSLNNPREKVWGKLVALTGAGVTIQGLDLNSFNDWMRQVLDAEPEVIALATVFYPMHRVERVSQDERAGDFPSLAERFEDRIGISLLEYLRMPRNVR